MSTDAPTPARPALPSTFSSSTNSNAHAAAPGAPAAPDRPALPARPASGIPHFETRASSTARPLRFFHPTRAELTGTPSTTTVSDSPAERTSHWSSRASRKNRYAPSTVRVTHHRAKTTADAAGKPQRVVVAPRLRHAHTRLKVHLAWDISFWVAVVFVLGSTAWVVNGFILFLPLLFIGGDHTTAAAWWAFAGGTLFEVGSYLMLVEALNAGHEALFGPALWGLVARPAPGAGGGGGASEEHLRGAGAEDEENGKGAAQGGKFRWIGLGDWRELGFLASFIQMWAATIFWVSTITGLPGVIANFPLSPPTAITDVFFWTPQVIGGSGFIISSLLLMLEVQKRWWAPNLGSLGWHVGLWNLIGAVGFTLCGALGYASLASSGANYQSVLSTFWGGWAFLIGSAVQLWETLWREAPEGGDGSGDGAGGKGGDREKGQGAAA